MQPILVMSSPCGVLAIGSKADRPWLQRNDPPLASRSSRHSIRVEWFSPTRNPTAVAVVVDSV